MNIWANKITNIEAHNGGYRWTLFGTTSIGLTKFPKKEFGNFPVFSDLLRCWHSHLLILNRNPPWKKIGYDAVPNHMQFGRLVKWGDYGEDKDHQPMEFHLLNISGWPDIPWNGSFGWMRDKGKMLPSVKGMTRRLQSYDNEKLYISCGGGNTYIIIRNSESDRLAKPTPSRKQPVSLFEWKWIAHYVILQQTTITVYVLMLLYMLKCTRLRIWHVGYRHPRIFICAQLTITAICFRPFFIIGPRFAEFTMRLIFCTKQW